VQLGYLPRVAIDHTSAREFGQIYIPGVNWLLMLACIGLVVGFGSSSRLAAAYGVAVTTTMVITTLLFFVVARERWHWGLAHAVALTGLLLVVDLAFWAANILKIPHGGWFPLVAGGVIFGLMATWKRGRMILRERLEQVVLPVELFLQDVGRHFSSRVPGTAVFMYSDPAATPPALLHNLKHNKVLHERVVFLVVETANVPHVLSRERARVEELGNGFFRVTLRYGFMEEPDVPQALSELAPTGLIFKHLETTYFLGRETLIPTDKPGMAPWRERLFTVMHRNARTATSFFCLPPNRVVELGAQIEL
jgi:KUP system potassium uptake protein